MGKTGKRPQPRCHNGSSDSEDSSGVSTESSDSGERRPRLQADRYNSACLQQGLTYRACRVHALAELQELLTRGAYQTAPKQLQQCLFDDLRLAVAQQDSRQQAVQATAALLAAAKRLLPQQKRQQLVSQHRRAGIRASRRHQGTDTAAASDGDGSDADDPVMLSDVPQEVVRLIMRSLDPLSLAAAAAVCRSWRELATGDELWVVHLQQIFPAAARHWHQQQQRQQQPPPQPPTTGMAAAAACFSSAAQRHSWALLPWRSPRLLQQGRLQWAECPPAAPLAAAAAVRAARRGLIPAGPLYVTPAQAVSWMLGASVPAILQASRDADDGGGDTSSSSSGTGSGSDSDGDESHLLLSRKVLRLWAV